MLGCFEHHTLVQYTFLEDTLNPKEKRKICKHLKGCLICAAQVEKLDRTALKLFGELLMDPRASKVKWR